MDEHLSIPFDAFWQWLREHANCILRAGTADTILYDDEDLHWNFTLEEDGTRLAQILKGKRAMGELFLDEQRVSYVQSVPSGNESEYLFELVSVRDSQQTTAYFFVMVHDYESEVSPERQIH